MIRRSLLTRWGVVLVLVAGMALLSLSSDILDQRTTSAHLSLSGSLSLPVDQEKTLVWVFTRDAYASCRQPAYVLRRIRQHYGDTIPLVVWYEFDDENGVDQILTRERLAADLRPLDFSEYQRFFGESPEPAVHLFDAGRLIESWAYKAKPFSVEDITKHL